MHSALFKEQHIFMITTTIIQTIECEHKHQYQIQYNTHLNRELNPMACPKLVVGFIEPASSPSTPYSMK